MAVTVRSAIALATSAPPAALDVPLYAEQQPFWTPNQYLSNPYHVLLHEQVQDFAVNRQPTKQEAYVANSSFLRYIPACAASSQSLKASSITRAHMVAV